LRLARRNKPKSMAVDIDVANCLLDPWHVASDALAAATTRLVMCVLFDGGRARSVGRARPVAFQAHAITRLNQVGVIRGAMDIVATEARNAVRVHSARNEIVALHTVLVCRPVGEV